MIAHGHKAVISIGAIVCVLKITVLLYLLCLLRVPGCTCTLAGRGVLAVCAFVKLRCKLNLSLLRGSSLGASDRKVRALFLTLALALE